MQFTGCRRFALLVMFLALAAMHSGTAYAQMEQANITFHAEEVFYNSNGHLIVAGVFHNQGNRAGYGIEVDHLYVFQSEFPSDRFDDYVLIAYDSFKDQNLAAQMVGPGQRMRWTFNFGPIQRPPIVHWWVRTFITYRW